MLRNNYTNEVRTYESNKGWSDAEEYWWTDGNFGCDCNRHLTFIRIQGKELADNEEAPCGEVRYSALYVEFEDGSKVEIDEP